MDNLNTHEPGSFMKLFRRIKQKHYGKDLNLSILQSTELANMAEIELNVLTANV